MLTPSTRSLIRTIPVPPQSPTQVCASVAVAATLPSSASAVVIRAICRMNSFLPDVSLAVNRATLVQTESVFQVLPAYVSNLSGTAGGSPAGRLFSQQSGAVVAGLVPAGRGGRVGVTWDADR